MTEEDTFRVLKQEPFLQVEAAIGLIRMSEVKEFLNRSGWTITEFHTEYYNRYKESLGGTIDDFLDWAVRSYERG